jgi:hypothetical protein
MTAFRHGRTRAHVMEWAGNRSQWESACSRPELAVKPGEWDDAKDWPLRYVGMHERLVPWCSGCVRDVQRRVDSLTNDVLTPAAEEAS